MSLRRHLYHVIEHGRGDDRRSKAFDGCLVLLILANIAAFCAETVPSIAADWGVWLHRFEAMSIIVFTLEYAARLWTAVELPQLARTDPLKARLKFASRPLLVIDLLAVLPYYAAMLFVLDLRVLRAFRLLRFFKLARYSPALHTLMRVLSQESRALTGAGMVLLAVLLFSSTGMYFIEGSAQPDKFGSVPLAAYWAMTTLTTVGYGDVVPITPLGKFWSMLTMICGLCVLALPVAIISTGFAQEVGRRDFVVTWSLMSRIPLLAGLDANEVTDILPMMHAQNIPSNTEVIGKGSTVDAMYFIASGGVRLTADGGDMDFRTGDFFGVVAMVDATPAIGRYISTSRCRLLKLYRDDFLRLEAVNPSLAGRIRQIASDRHNIRCDLIARLSRDGS